MMGKNNMLHHMNRLDWPEKHINAITLFYFKLEDHPMRSHPHGDKILIAFQAKTQHEWHAALECNEGFNLSKINSDALGSIVEEFHDNLHNKGKLF